MTEDWFALVSEMLGNYSGVKLGSEAYHTLLTTVYCTNPAEDDGCPVGMCPNPDVAGTLLRIARKFPPHSSRERLSNLHMYLFTRLRHCILFE